MRIPRPLLPMVAALALGACSSSGSPSAASKSDATYTQEITQAMHASLARDIDELIAGALAIQAAAPTPSGRGWDRAKDADAIVAMKTGWRRARSAYERIEGAVAPLFPDVDEAIDFRYDDFLAAIKDADRANGDPDPFDGQIVTGMHAIERILYADTIPAYVVEFEKTQKGYRPAAAPATEAEALRYKTSLCQKLVDDAKSLRDQWRPQRIDLPGAFGGLVSLMNEQQEKVTKASTSEEESRYAQRTMQDIRDNLEGTLAIYKLFQPWILSKPDGKATDQAIQDALKRLSDAYAKHPGDAIPPVPATWSAESPSAQDLATPFGQLYAAVRDAADTKKEASAVSQMNRAARVLGFPELQSK